MTRVAWTIAIFAGLLAGQQPKPGTGTISGQVLSAASGAPVRKASVELRERGIALAAETDAEGKYQFSGLPAGNYRLSAKRPGFLERLVRRPVVVPEDGKVTAPEIRLPAQGAISGRILDEDGDPVGISNVLLYRQVYRDGVRRWEVNQGGLSDENGEYHIGLLTPGRYLVSANPRSPLVVDNHYGGLLKRGPVPTYYPHAESQDAATPVDVSAGGEARGMDVRIAQVVAPPMYRLKGKVSGLGPQFKMVVLVNFISADRGTYEIANTRAPDYTFEQRLRPGPYTIFARVQNGEPEFYGLDVIRVTGDAENLLVPMSPPPVLTGRIRVEGDQLPSSVKAMEITLNTDSRVQAGNAQARPDPAGQLSFSNPLPPGHYTVHMQHIPDGYFVDVVKFGGREVSLDGIDVTASGQLEITLSPTAGKISGSAVDGDGKAYGNAIVTLVPEDGKSHPVKVDAGEDGGFTFGGLRPGKYRVFAWEDVDEGVWQDPDFCKRNEARSSEVKVGERETASPQVKVIGLDEMK